MSQSSQRKYNVTIILDTRGYESPVETIEEKVSGILAELGGEVESVENLGRRDFARVPDNRHEGDTYLTVLVSGSPGLPAAFQDRVHLDPLIKRVMFQSA
ncbi:MAG: 30S ribosomal protein S6 [Oceanipulchritudo sp.]